MTNKNKWEEIAKQTQQYEEVEMAASEESKAKAQADFEAESKESSADAEDQEPANQAETESTEVDNRIAALVLQVEELRDKAIRAQAELDNVRRRAERDVSNAHKFGSTKLIESLLPVFDSLERGLAGIVGDDERSVAMREGLQMTLDLLESTLQKHGVEVINPEQGVAFNPDRHEAMSMQPAEGVASNHVVAVMQKGFALNERVLRAAMVIVAT